MVIAGDQAHCEHEEDFPSLSTVQTHTIHVEEEGEKLSSIILPNQHRLKLNSNQSTLILQT